MKICVAQIKPTKGDIAKNIQAHLTLIQSAVAHQAAIIVFPELSITSYEPELAKDLAMYPNDGRLEVFQTRSDTHQVVIGIGVPTKNDQGICISMLIFQPNQPREVYSKKYLHADEEPYFVKGDTPAILNIQQTKIGLAICYEVFVEEHAENACDNGVKVYLSSVAKGAKGVEKAYQRMPEIAKKYGIPVLMANCVGPCDNFVGAGNSAIWNDKGVIIGRLEEMEEGILMMNK